MIFANILVYILPIRFIALGLLYKIRAKEEINQVSGFRTNLSKKSKENWAYANKYGGNIILIISLVFLLVNIGFQLKSWLDMDTALRLVAGQVLVYILSRLEIQRALKKYDKKIKD